MVKKKGKGKPGILGMGKLSSLMAIQGSQNTDNEKNYWE